MFGGGGGRFQRTWCMVPIMCVRVCVCAWALRGRPARCILAAVLIPDLVPHIWGGAGTRGGFCGRCTVGMTVTTRACAGMERKRSGGGASCGRAGAISGLAKASGITGDADVMVADACGWSAAATARSWSRMLLLNFSYSSPIARRLRRSLSLDAAFRCRLMCSWRSLYFILAGQYEHCTSLPLLKNASTLFWIKAFYVGGTS